MFRKRVLSTLLCLAVLLTGMSLPVSVSAEPSGGIAGLEAYLQSSTALPDDGYLGIPVDLYLYHNGATTDQTPVILYVINTNTERIGTDSDFSIVNEMLSEKGYIVVVLDYKNNEQSVSPGLDWSVQNIRTKIDSYGMYLGGAAYKKSYAYIVPSGYNITLDEYYWSIDKHGADGVLDMIVNVWNNDFKSVYGDETIHYSDGTTKKVSEVTASSIYDCVKKDGTPLDMDLRMDIIYPTNPAEKVPVYSVASSAESRVATWTSAMRPHLTGFLFSGYAGVIFDYAYVRWRGTTTTATLTGIHSLRVSRATTIPTRYTCTAGLSRIRRQSAKYAIWRTTKGILINLTWTKSAFTATPRADSAQGSARKTRRRWPRRAILKGTTAKQDTKTAIPRTTVSGLSTAARSSRG